MQSKYFPVPVFQLQSTKKIEALVGTDGWYSEVTTWCLGFLSKDSLPTTVVIHDLSAEGRQLLKGSSNLLFFKIVAENCMKMKEFGPREGGRKGHVTGNRLGSAT